MPTSRQKRRNPLPVVVVTWVDAHDNPAHIDSDQVDEEHKPNLVHSVGWLLKKDKKGVTIARCYDDEKESDASLFVPTGMIQSVRKV